MLPASSIMSRWQTKKFTTQDLIIYVLNKSEHRSVMHCIGLWRADCINEALIGPTTIVAIATKPYQSHNVASSVMFSILSHDLVTSESKVTLNPHCSFSFNETSDFS